METYQIGKLLWRDIRRKDQWMSFTEIFSRKTITIIKEMIKIKASTTLKVKTLMELSPKENQKNVWAPHLDISRT